MKPVQTGDLSRFATLQTPQNMKLEKETGFVLVFKLGSAISASVAIQDNTCFIFLKHGCSTSVDGAWTVLCLSYLVSHKWQYSFTVVYAQWRHLALLTSGCWGWWEFTSFRFNTNFLFRNASDALWLLPRDSCDAIAPLFIEDLKIKPGFTKCCTYSNSMNRK